MTAQPFRIDDLVERALAARPARRLLSGLGAKILIASDLPSRARSRESLATGVAPLDRLLAGGLPKGELVELAGRRSSGRFSIGLSALASVTSTGEPAAFVDLGEHLDPWSACEAGVDLERLLWVRPRRVKEALASAEMLLAAGFPLVVADLGLSPRGTRYVPDAAWLRLARAAQAQGAALLLLTPWRMSGIAADAVLTADSFRPRWQGAGKTPRLLTTLDSRLTLQKLARSTPGTAAPLSLTVFPAGLPLPASSLSLRERVGVRGVNLQSHPKSSIHPAPLEIRDPHPQIQNSIRSITNHKSPITNSSSPLRPTTHHLPPSS